MVLNFRLSTLDPNMVSEKLHNVFKNLKCAAKVNIALGFVLRNVENGQFRYFYAHENNTLFDKSLLLCTRGDLTKIQEQVQNSDLLEQCVNERRNCLVCTRWFALCALACAGTFCKYVPHSFSNFIITQKKC